MIAELYTFSAIYIDGSIVNLQAYAYCESSTQKASSCAKVAIGIQDTDGGYALKSNWI